MPIEPRLGVLVGAEPAIGRLAEEKLPFQAAYRVTKLLRAVGEEIRHFHEERNKLVRSYGEPRNGGGPEDIVVLPTSPNFPAFRDKLEELAAVQITLALDPLDLAAIPTLSIAATDLFQLGPLMKE